jgi:hypothetical protein
MERAAERVERESAMVATRALPRRSSCHQNMAKGSVVAAA